MFLNAVTVTLQNKQLERRTHTANGREYLVLSATLIVPGVLPGSAGPLSYSVDDLEKSVSAWNAIPVVLNHPPATPEGKVPSARTTEYLQSNQIGFLLDTHIENSGSLVATAWLDIEVMKKIAPQHLTALEQGQALEVSTGLDGELDTSTDPPRVMNIRPDHLAVLPFRIRGACSLDDGCGIGNQQNNRDSPATSSLLSNSEDSQRDGQSVTLETKKSESSTLNKEQIVTQILNAGCGCYTETDKDYLLKLSEERLMSIIANSKSHQVDGSNGHKDSEETKVEPEKAKGFDEWMKNAPPEVRAVLNHAKQMVDEKRRSLVELIIANSSGTEETKVRKRQVLSGMDIPSLEILAEGVREVEEQASIANQYFAGYVPAPTVNRIRNFGQNAGAGRVQNNAEADDPLEIPVIDWSK